MHGPLAAGKHGGRLIARCGEPASLAAALALAPSPHDKATVAKIHLVRHARPSAGWGGHDPDPGLDVVGRGQARTAAERLARLAPQGFQRLISSPMRRCRETAAPLAASTGLAVEIEPAFSEVPSPVGLSLAARSTWLANAMAGRWRDMAGDRDYEAWRRETAATVRRYPGCAIFTHFVALNAIISFIDGRDEVVVFRPDHASITRLDLDGERLGVDALGEQAVTGVA